MLRFIILMLLAGSVFAINKTEYAELLLQVEKFAKDVNKSVPIHPMLQEGTQQELQSEDKSAKLIVFISTSMSKTSIKQWAVQADLLGAELVIRGFINNSFKDTVLLAQELFDQDNVGGFNVDPLKFKTYDIQIVPAVVLDVGGKVDLVQGDIGLIEALKIIKAKGENAGEVQNYLLKI